MRIAGVACGLGGRDTGPCLELGLLDEECTLPVRHRGWHLDADTGWAWSAVSPRWRIRFTPDGVHAHQHQLATSREVLR